MSLLAAAALAVPLCTPFLDESTDLYGYLGCDGTVGLPATLHVAEPFNECGIAAVLDPQGWRYIDKQGQVLLAPKIMDNGPDPFSEGLARFIEDDKYGYFDTCGRVVIPARYDFALPFEQGSAQAGFDCEFPPVGEYRSYRCERWVTLPHPGVAP